METILLEHVKGCGTKITHHLREAHLWSTYDLVLRLPKRYDDFKVSNIEQARHMSMITLIGEIISPVKVFNKGKLSIIQTKILIEHTKIDAVAFNQPFLAQLKVGDKVLVKGKYNYFTHKLSVTKMTKNLNQPPIKPIYDIENVTDYSVSKILEEIYNKKLVNVYESLPFQIINEQQLLSREKALEVCHFPKSEQELEKALYRFKYEEALMQQLRFTHELSQRTKRPVKQYDLDKVKKAIQQIPYELTHDQKQTVNDIFRDFKETHVSFRLIQGDVGSGKTIVSFLAAIGAITSGNQVAFMAPTEALARQHYENFNSMFKEYKTALLTSSSKNQEAIKACIKKNEVSLVIGTQSLLSEGVEFNDLGLVIIDEQHKFGVDDRKTLEDKSKHTDTIYLTATPIPRSMAMAYYGHMSTSVIKEKPKHQLEVITELHTDTKIKSILKQIKNNSEKEEQTYVVVPAIYDNKLPYSIETVSKLLEKEVSDKHLYVLHSRLKNSEQQEMMEKFLNDKKGVLLATTMIEVGIDCKNATLMVILGAEYFGLSQLHQLRGRVGRGHKQSYCIMLSQKTEIERLNVMVETSDGFALSQMDLKLRGAGNLLGNEQTGFIKYEFLDLSTDTNILDKARIDAKRYYGIIDKYPYLYKKITINE